MSSASSVASLCVTACFLLTACQRETRSLRSSPAMRAFDEPSVSHQLQPGGSQPNAQGGVTAANEYNPYEGNAYAISEGSVLYNIYNCKGCHMGGGGDIGPPLISEKYRYGSEPGEIYNTIAYGRRNGMPAWGARIPKYQIWQLVAYVRALHGSQPAAATPGREDALQKSREAVE